ncbi:UDP-N-acetylmuramoyl-L-alanine--D-glutamate ligase [Phaeodactylibacter sp.]|uniref:UDP-N-acetylmuramoyl-L-alanine--D-glutamate ligase n=1 Tax=Phaeodactylibacter sp. TaxID=1940289 RepID=UPI0025F2CFDF|nr:UDP-N-acetylmuramoyl-L-alanine--D-glutamate ligase [Phaeodactylibacter sp.]MCI4648315.1 UDP-N-acetylmuramoyl-L-alanine--D-glutamate ligase [Phaeodactylibacter sp.]MCI5090416.1 UDP-N-acetylmuramoyl-L-alanine--D-glutamate ligase [Phaeodactylibacter sp.]
MKNIVILGAGESGVGAALLAQQNRHHVFVSDRGGIAEKYKRELESHGIAYEEGQHTRERILQADEVIKSPGIPDHVPLIKELVSKGIPVIAEIEYAARYHQSKVMGITGSNGKTTTTRLAFHLLQTAGFDVEMGGNVGKSFARCLTEPHRAYYVLELSSFQLDGIVDFRPDIGMILNISPDHLDRYDYKMENYIRSKFRISMNQRPEDVFLYQAKNEHIAAFLPEHDIRAEALPMLRAALTENGFIAGGHHFDLQPAKLRGEHNAFNALFATTAALRWGAAPEAIQRGLENFTPVPHRMELVGTYQGVEYINDSKATNVDAVYYALDAMPKGVVWIAGGQDKGNDYEPLLPLVREKVRAMVALGIDNTKLKATFEGLVDTFVEARSAEEAVEQAARLAKNGEKVLLSPACASFDLFKNYEQRGELFKAAVRQLK